MYKRIMVIGMEVDKSSLAWIGYSALWRGLGLSEKEIERRWQEAMTQKVILSWDGVAKAISDEAIRRYKAAEWPAEKSTPTKLHHRNILEITRDLSR